MQAYVLSMHKIHMLSANLQKYVLFLAALRMLSLWQVLMCHNPHHLVSLTLNHLDAILAYTTSPPVRVGEPHKQTH